MKKLNGVITNLRIMVVMAVVATTIVVFQLPSFASPTGLDACFFRDLNGSSIQGDSTNVGAGDEVAFTEPISVELVDQTTGGTTLLTTNPTTGCVDFPNLADATNYQLNVTYPPEYRSSPTGGDTDFTPNGAPATAGDPFTSTYTFTYTTGDDLAITGGVSGIPQVSLGYFITPSGNPLIETGTASFNTSGNCPVQEPGDDCGELDDVVRTNDITTIGYTITADNIPDPNTNPLNDIVVEQVITPNNGAVVSVPSLHPNCLTSGVSPVSSIDTDPATGVVTVTCNIGPKGNGTSILPMFIKANGDSTNGSFFEVDARVYTGDDSAQLSDESIIATEEIFVSAAPRFDITKGNDASNPFNRVIFLQFTERVNPNTGLTELGAGYRWDISVLYDGGAKGQAALAEPITFSDVIPAEFPGFKLLACRSNPQGGGGLPADLAGPQDWGERGTWNCVEDRANNEIDVTVTNVDTDGDPVPTQGNNGTDLSSGPFVAFAGSIDIWYPVSDFYRSVDPDWQPGDDPIEGTYPLNNVISNFAPVDSTGQENYGGAGEPTENNDRTTNVQIAEAGAFSKLLGSYEWADGRIPDGSLTGTAALWPCSGGAIAGGSLPSGQTQTCNAGDAPAQPGERAHFWFWLRNQGTFPWPADTVALCDAFDNTTMSLTQWTGGETLYIRGSFPDDAYIVEYATAGFNNDPTTNDWTDQVAAVRDCAAPNNDWSEDPFSFDADPDTSLEMVGMVRVRLDSNVVSEVAPSQFYQVSLPVEIRNTFNGGPNDGELIPPGTVIANNANRTFGSTAYTNTVFGAENYTQANLGDRLILNRHQVRISKTASVDTTSPTDDDLSNVEGSDTVIWWLQPAVTAVTSAIAPNVQVIDTLPAGITFDSFCQTSQAYPDADVSLSSVTNNPDGTTTLLFDLGDRPTNVAIGPIPVCTTIDNFLDPGTDLTNNVEIRSDTDVSPEGTRSDERTVSVIASGEFQLIKAVDAPLELQLDTQAFTIGWSNLSDDFDFQPPDVIDVWPYNGDALNPLNERTEFDSNFSGSYELTSWLPQPTTTAGGGATRPTTGTWYYTADDPNTVPYDAAHPDNDLAAPGGVNWCTQAELTIGTAPCDFTFSDSTGARFVQEEILSSRETVTVNYTFQAGSLSDPNLPGDRYVNRFAARTASVSGLIRSNEVLVQVLSMSLGDLVFLDADVDGAFTPGIDVPIQGTAVELWIDNDAGTFVQADSTITDADGRYIFEGLLEGTYEVRIPDAELNGGTLDTFTQTVNPIAADNDDNENIDHQASNSGLGYTTSGPVTLSADTTVDPPLGLEPVGDNVLGIGNMLTFDNLTNLTVDLGFRGDPAVRLVKEVCDPAVGSCDLTTSALDPSDGWVETTTVAFTDTAQWRISILNTGFEVLTNIAVADDAEPGCNQAAGSIPDLGIGESFAYVCSTSNVLRDVLNTAAVSAEGLGSRDAVEDDDSAAVETPPEDPDIEVVKFVNGNDAQTAPGIFIDPGSQVTFTYEVTLGSGIVPLADVAVDDDNGTPLDATDDFAAVFVNGDTDGDNRLDIGETWLFEATGFTALADQYANWATATGTPVTAGAAELSDIDPAHYFGVEANSDLTKLVNGQDANSTPGISVAAGDPITFSYVVENTGNTPLFVVAFTDDAGTTSDPTDDWTPVLVSGDTDGDGLIDTTETWTFEHTGETAVANQYTNLAVITLADPLGNQVNSSDPANYFGTNPAFAVEKSTNGADADVDPVLVGANSALLWEYVLTNTGNAPISSPQVEDDNGTPADTTDDFIATFVSGDANGDGVLDLDETWIFQATGTATELAYTNNAIATGEGPTSLDVDGNPVAGVPVEAEDPSSYIVASPDVAITKATNRVNSATAPGVLVRPGDLVTWTYTVTNPGDVPLSNVMVSDDNGTAALLTDDLTAAFISGDANGDGLLDVDETWTFQATGTAIAGQYQNRATVTATPPEVTDPDGTTSDPPTVTDSDDDYYFGIDPEIEIVKATNGTDNAAAPGIYVAPGDPVTWTYTVTNTGNIAVAAEVSDDNGTPADSTDDFTATLVSGDTNGDGLLDLDETWTFQATGTAIVGQYQNTAVATGTPPEVTNPDGTTSPATPVTANDDDYYFGAEPVVAIVKSTNGTDNAAAPGVFITPGDPVTWTYTVTNTGNIALSNVAVSDDNGTPTLGDDFAPTLVSGDTNGDGLLDLDETWTFQATGTAIVGQYQNRATVTATPPEVTDPDGTTSNPPTVTDSDDDYYFGATPGIEIVKLTNGIDNAAAPGIYVAPGDPVTWTYTVTNTGNVPLTVRVSDDNGTPTLGDDFTASLVTGDTNGDGLLDLDETWTFQATGTAIAGQYQNTATVTAAPPAVTNPDGTTSDPPTVTDSDDDYYFGATPGIAIVKLTNGIDNAAAPGVNIPVGDPVTWTYVVSNSGDVLLSGVTISDDSGTPATGDDFAPTLVSGDADGDGLLDLDETWTFEATGTAIVGQYQNTAVATGTPPEVTNPDGTTSNPPTVTDSDDDYYFGIEPGIEIVKLTNGIDNAAAPGVFITPGDPVTWTYTVTNTGNIAVAAEVSDDNGTPATLTDDFAASLVTGDTNGDDLLDLDETWTFQATGTAIAGQYQNTATVTAAPPAVTNPDGTTSPATPVTADDDDYYFGATPGIAITKLTNGIDNAAAPGVNIPVGDPVTWTYVVSNSGDVPLGGITVSDDNGTPADSTDDFTATLVSGDTNGDGLLDLDETWTFEATGTAIVGQYQNTAVATGTPPEVTNPDGTTSPATPVTANDDDYYFGAGSGIAITKLTNGTDTTTGTGPFIVRGDTVTWTYEVTNPGNVPLSNVSVADDNGTPADSTDDFTATLVSGDTNGDGLLDLDETWTFEATGTAIAGQYQNTAVATGTPPEVTNPDGTTSPATPVTADDDDYYFGAEPAVAIIKAVNNDDANDTPGVLVPEGEEVSWTYTVTNTGTAPLVDVSVVDDQGVAVTCPTTTLDIGEEMVCTGAAEAATLGQYTNIGTVQGTPGEPTETPGVFAALVDPTTGAPVESVSARDAANHFGTGPGVEIVKTVCTFDDTSTCDIENEDHWGETTVIADGDDVTWRIQVVNLGNIDLIDIVVADPLAPSCQQTRPLLTVGETWTYACSESGTTEPTTNTASVEATPADGGSPAITSSDSAETLEPAELALAKSVDQTGVLVGDTVTYEIELTNTGVLNATDIEVLDTLPAGITSIAFSTTDRLFYNEADHTIVWSIAELAAGETAVVSYSAEVESTGDLVNEVAILSDHEENNLDNNSDSASITASPVPESAPPLAFTGANSMTTVVWALTLLGLGVVLVILARRRQLLSN